MTPYSGIGTGSRVVLNRLALIISATTEPRRTDMRNTILVITIVLTLLSVEIRSVTQNPAPADVGPGRVAWFDITTTDLPKSKEFYAKLFDWDFTALKETNQAVEIVSRGTSIGTLRVADGKISGFNGVVYVQVSDIRASCKKAKELGATIPAGFPFNLTDRSGAIAIIVDPAGHPLGMYSRTRLAPATPLGD